MGEISGANHLFISVSGFLQGRLDIIRAFHFQQKQSSTPFLGVTPIIEKSKHFSCNGFSRLFGARPDHPSVRYSLPPVLFALMAFCGQF